VSICLEFLTFYFYDPTIPSVSRFELKKTLVTLSIHDRNTHIVHKIIELIRFRFLNIQDFVSHLTERVFFSSNKLYAFKKLESTGIYRCGHKLYLYKIISRTTIVLSLKGGEEEEETVAAQTCKPILT